MTTRTATVPGIDVRAFDSWLRRAHPHLAGPDALSAAVIAGGRSNLTYRLAGTAVPLVLRRPPLSHVQATAHDMHREFRVLSALAGTAVPVPRTRVLVDTVDEATGVDAPFYVMDFVDGDVLRSPTDDHSYSPDERRVLSFELIDVLADLHAIDPDSIGLADFGRADGFLTRQVARWRKQYDGSRSRELPDLDALADRLAASVPPTVQSGLLHGDFRLDNAIVVRDATDRPRIAAVLDWEMAAIGDVHADLALCLLYWDLSSVAAGSVVASAIVPGVGYPTADELLARYAERSPVPLPDFAWYRGFAAFKLAVILEGVHFRYLQGGTVGAGFSSIGQIVPPLAAHGLAALNGSAT